MGTVIPLRFRPTVVICVGEQGRAVGEQLALLLPGLDAARRAGVAMLAVTEASPEEEDRVVGSWMDPAVWSGDHLHLSREVGSGVGTPLSLLMVEALRGQNPRDLPEHQAPHRGVLDDLVVRRVREAGYGVPRATVVVWLAAAAHSPSLVPIVREVRAALRSEEVEAWILLALPNIYPRDLISHAVQAQRCHDQAWPALLVGAQSEPPLATYAYLFESHGEQGTFWEGPDDVPFAAAEAIFMLTASGITTTREFEETLRLSLPQLVHHPYERLSSIGTSRLSFPRAQVEAFSAHRLGAGVMREWARSRSITLPLATQTQHKHAARETMAEVRRRLRDAAALQRGGRASPRLSADTIARVRGLERPTPDGGLIFRHFSLAELDRLDDGRRALVERLAVQRAKAEEGLPVWKSTIRQGWERYGQVLERKVATYADDLILDGPEGVAQARAYTEELNRQLTREREALGRLREDREVDYERFLTDKQELAHGPWENASAAQNPAPAPAQPAGGPAAVTLPLSPVRASVPLAAHEMPTEAEPPSREEAILRDLTTRHAWLEARVPKLPALLGVGMMMVPPWVLLLQNLLPTRWMSGVWSVLLLTLAVIALVAGLCAGYYQLRARRAAEAANDMRHVYRRLFAHRCERHEDERREALLVGVHARVRRMLDRLADWDAFATSLAERLEASAREIEHGLFEGAMGRRDVVVANRQRLHPHGYNLHHLDDDIAARRRAQPVEGFEWHASHSAMLEPLREHLRGQVSLMGEAPEGIVGPVREFCASVARPYISGDICDLAAALEAMPASQTAGLFDHLIERSTSLYRPMDPPRAPVSFVAARDEQHDLISERSQAADMVTLSLQDREWMGVLRLLPGGAVPAFHDMSAYDPALVRMRTGMLVRGRRAEGEPAPAPIHAPVNAPVNAPLNAPPRSSRGEPPGPGSAPP
ncbi:MAG TPA: hypothetical protein VFY89_02830, partial [Ktedonobacterales bacterium]